MITALANMIRNVPDCQLHNYALYYRRFDSTIPRNKKRKTKCSLMQRTLAAHTHAFTQDIHSHTHLEYGQWSCVDIYAAALLWAMWWECRVYTKSTFSVLLCHVSFILLSFHKCIEDVERKKRVQFNAMISKRFFSPAQIKINIIFSHTKSKIPKNAEERGDVLGSFWRVSV